MKIQLGGKTAIVTGIEQASAATGAAVRVDGGVVRSIV